MKKTIPVSVLLILMTFVLIIPACAQVDELPVASYTQWFDCGESFQIKLVSQPVVSGSQSGLISDGDLSYLTFRLGIKYLGSEIWKGFEPDSFKVTEYYKGQSYNEYALAAVISGLIESDWSSPAFFEPITLTSPEINTILAFEVYPEVEGWDFTFTPHMRGADITECEVSFRLPKASVRD